MFDKIVVAFLAVAFSGVVFTAPSTHNDQGEPQARVVQFENKSHEKGKYSVTYALNNGFNHSESGYLTNGSNVDDTRIVQGKYSFMGQGNVTYEICYYVDEDGFHTLIGTGTGVSWKLLQTSVG